MNDILDDDFVKNLIKAKQKTLTEVLRNYKTVDSVHVPQMKEEFGEYTNNNPDSVLL